MHSPSTLPDAIVRTFRDYNKEYQETYEDFAKDVKTLQGDGSRYVGRGLAQNSIGEAGSRRRSAFNVRPVLSDAFSRSTDVQGQRSWAETAKSRELYKDGPSPREMAVREALYGSWESGAQILPGLEGVEEYMHVEGEQPEQVGTKGSETQVKETEDGL